MLPGPAGSGPWERAVRRAARVVLLAGGVVVVGLLLQVVFSRVIAPQLRIRQVVVHGDLPLSTVDLRRLAGIDGSDHLLDVDAQAVAERIAAHPLVESASVRARIPGTLEINAVRRRPLAMALAMIDDRSVPVVFDSSGVVMQVDPAPVPELPFVSGLRFARRPRPGLVLPAGLLPAVAALASIRDGDARLFGMISELVVTTGDAGALDLAFYPSSYPVAVRLGPRLDVESMRHAFVALEVLSAGGAQMPPEIDFRAGEAVYVESANGRSPMAAPRAVAGRLRGGG